MKNGLKSMAFAMMLMTACLAVVSCDNDDKPYSPSQQDSAVVGKWQKYARVEEDGSLSGGDPDEFWIFEADGVSEMRTAVTSPLQALILLREML